MRSTLSCEACHGPGSAHVCGRASALRQSPGGSRFNGPCGAARPWRRRVEMKESARGVAQWVGACPHSCRDRRVRPLPRAAAADRRSLSPWSALPRHRHAGSLDGRPLPRRWANLGGVYEYGSVLQSRMHRAGVTSPIATIHTRSSLRAPGNGVCAQCHLPARFDVPAHHHHAVGTDGARCVKVTCRNGRTWSSTRVATTVFGCAPQYLRPHRDTECLHGVPQEPLGVMGGRRCQDMVRTGTRAALHFALALVAAVAVFPMLNGA